MKIIKTGLLILSMAFVQACSADEPRLNTESFESTEKSIDVMAEQLTDQEERQLRVNLAYLAAEYQKDNLLSKNEEFVLERIHLNLNGRTAAEINEISDDLASQDRLYAGDFGAYTDQFVKWHAETGGGDDNEFIQEANVLLAHAAKKLGADDGLSKEVSFWMHGKTFNEIRRLAKVLRDSAN